MDGSKDRASGIPRPSRLPIPRQASAIPRPSSMIATPNSSRLAPSRESTSDALGGSELRNPKLRASASRGQLRSSVIASSRDSPLRSTASREQLRPAAVRTSVDGRNISQAAVANRRTSRIVSTPQRQSSRTSTPMLHIDAGIDAPEDVLHQGIAAGGYSNFDDDQLPAAADTLPRDNTKPRSSKPRQSLSERTMETLAQIPSSPALTKKSSSFFDQGRPRSRAESANSRPGSSYNSDGSGRMPSRPPSRPGSSTDYDDGAASFRASTNPFKSQLSTIDGTPESALRPARIPNAQRASGRVSLAAPSQEPSLPPADNRSPSLEKKPFAKGPLKSGSKSVAARPLKTRSSVNGLFKKPSLQSINGAATTSETPRRTSRGMAPAESNKGDLDPPTPSSNRKSSSALRDQIAKAKSAKRAAMQQTAGDDKPSAYDETPIIPSDNGFDFGVDHDDPFNTRRGQDSKALVLKQRVAAARTTGRLNIAALGLKEMPSEVMEMYNLENMQGANWAESVDLTRLVAADNELETLADSVFPDCEPEAFNEDEDSQGNIFGGLEMLDLHGNKLTSLPMGIRRLTQLTSLNLSSSCLGNDTLDLLAQLPTLRDLKLASNRLTGELSSSLVNLTSLEILDLRDNKITALPASLENMSRLRILNMSDNSIASLPFDALAKLPLSELSIRKNKLSGTLIEAPIESLPLLQTLDVSLNQLTRLVPSGSIISLPVTHSLTLSVNRLQELPDMTTWTSLLTLTADENSISSIPEGFTSLEKLRHADFSGNDIRIVPPEIARMNGLSMLRLTGNPLRDRKFASASTDELKEMLSARLEPPPPYQEPGDQSTITELMSQVANMDVKGLDNADADSRSDEDFTTPPTSPSRSRSHTVVNSRSRSQTMVRVGWPVKPGGLLDRSRTESSSLIPKICSETAAQSQVRQIHLHHNTFSLIPSELSFFATTLSALTLSHNQLAGEAYLIGELSLPALREINLSSNHITSLGPLIAHLKAPALDKIDASLNRINALPLGIKDAFPQLTVLLASNNQLTELRPEAIKGLKIVDVASNDIGHLEPRIGLLGGQGGLTRLEVTGNRFKVPRWNILERGTEATLQWLRGRVPVEDMRIWSEENGEDANDDVD